MGTERSFESWFPLLSAMDGEKVEEGAEMRRRTRGLAEGSEEDWRWFHEQYYGALLRYAAQRVRDSSAAGDVVQEAYLRVARHVRPFAEPIAFWRWLCCVIRCVAIDQARGSKRRVVLLERFAHWRESHASEVTDLSGAGRPLEALAEEAMAKLPIEDAALLRRKYYEGCSTRDLAAECGTTAKAIENRLARVRERLRQIISSIP